MIKKSDIVKAAVQEQDWKKALQIAKGFRIGVTQEQRNKMARAYECIVHPGFYRQIGVDIPEAIEQGKAVVKEYAESTRRKNTMMKWDVKHDRAKRVIDAFLENAGYWQEREDLSAGLTDEDKALVSEEVALMIASIRKRYKLQERLPEQEPQIQLEEAKTEIPTVEAKETLPEPINEAEKEDKPEEEQAAADTEQAPEPVEKPKRGRKASGAEKKPAAKRGGRKKAAQEETAEQAEAAV
ncbi:MAG: hypothetical protein NC398_11705 [Acetatifactor muris]|nr:hypothetical protein [Acetatifactor muris]MCM1559615.1 hypothetical protein [Butyrivibrio sp.]